MTCPRGVVIGSSIAIRKNKRRKLLFTVAVSSYRKTSESDEDQDIAIEDALPVDGRVANGFVEHDGRMVHKASVVRILFSSDPKSSSLSVNSLVLDKN